MTTLLSDDELARTPLRPWHIAPISHLREVGNYERVMLQRRFRRMLVDPRCFLFKTGTLFAISSSLPADAFFVRAAYEFESDSMQLVIGSLEFDPMPPGHILPLVAGPYFFDVFE